MIENEPMVAVWLAGELGRPLEVGPSETGRSFQTDIGDRARRLDIASRVLDREPFFDIIAHLRAANVVERLKTDCTWAYLTPAGVTWLCTDHGHGGDAGEKRAGSG